MNLADQALPSAQKQAEELFAQVVERRVARLLEILQAAVDESRERSARNAEAFARVEGWTDFGQNYIPIGGILAGVRANKRVRLNVEMGVNGNELRVIGCLSAAVLGVPIVVEIVTDTGTSQLAPTKTDASGCFDIRQSLPRGRYAVQVFSSSTAQVAAAESSQQILMVT
jgi:hypothetical protein